jgi:hypothetical protein
MRVYLCSPYNGGNNDELWGIGSYGQDIKQLRRKRNRQYALECMTTLMKEKSYAVFAPHLLYTAILHEDNKIERRLGLQSGLEFLQECDMLVIGDKYGISEGMQIEIDKAKELGIETKI